MLQDIPRRVAALKQRQGSSGIFGAEKHRFRLRPHSPEEVALLELHLGVKLPEPYRQFLRLAFEDQRGINLKIFFFISTPTGNSCGAASPGTAARSGGGP